jgi:hypothetical protein
MKYTIWPLMFFALIGLFAPITQAAQPTPSPYMLLAQSDQSLASAVQSIKQQTGGRILSAKTINKNGQRVHKIKVLLPSGKVQTFNVSAE